MSTWREIDRVRKSIGEARDIARRLLIFADGFSDWESGFLESLVGKPAEYEFSVRQIEKLLQVRDECELISKFRDFIIATLIHKTYEARYDLNEDDEQWIVGLFDSCKTSIQRGHASRLMRCARQVGVVEEGAP